MPITIKVPKPTPSNKAENPPKPFIDKLTITLTIPTEKEREMIYGGLTAALFDKDAFQSSSPSKTHVYAKSIAFETTTKRARLDCKRKSDTGPDFRLEFNPRKIGEFGMSQLHATLTTLVPNGWEYFVKHGRVSRVDVAIDLVGHSMDSFIALPPHGVWSRLIGQDGSLETIYLGKSTGNQLKIYSKSARRGLLTESRFLLRSCGSRKLSRT